MGAVRGRANRFIKIIANAPVLELGGRFIVLSGNLHVIFWVYLTIFFLNKKANNKLFINYLYCLTYYATTIRKL